ncbi:Pilus assembly protein CpaB [Streptomyces graminofaciens]|uniref:Pilus assembly protein CpaB n=1 Tax=Streptomyces graminofaciens TaxID=68212 RepID=A0ABN5VMC1_9ACTN|nr:Flp pilus assembly protein CpaB [Streptomyces graminofaciens]BBC33287.1 Pilus assembly protein CpaB [Streptomyces graminofaciens]
MNSRQRRGVILLVLSALCALAAFAGVLSVVRDVNSKVGPEVTAYRLKSDIAPYKALSADQFEKISMPKRWLSGTAVTDLSDIRGKIAVTQLKKGSLLQTDMVVDSPELEPGQQEIAIMIDASTGVAGKINPGSRVNIYATFESKDSDSGKDTSKLLVTDARVIDVGKLTALESGQSSSERRRTATEAVPITFALDTADAQRVAYAESFAEHVRLALVASGDSTDVVPDDRSYTLDEDKKEATR